MGFILSGLRKNDYQRQYSDLHILRRILQACLRNKGQMLSLALATVFGAVCTTLLPIYTSYSIDAMQGELGPRQPLYLVLGMILFGIAIWILNALKRYMLASVQANVALHLRESVLGSLLAQDMAFYDGEQSGKLVSRTVSDTEVVSKTIHLISELLGQIMLVVLLFSYLFFLNRTFAFYILSFLPLILTIALSFRHYARSISEQSRGMTAELYGHIQEMLSGLGVAKSFGKEPLLHSRFETLNQQSYGIQLRTGYTFNGILPVLNILAGLFTVAMVYVAGRSVQAETLSIGDWFLLVQCISILWYPMTSVASFWSQFQLGLAAGERVFLLTDTQPTVQQHSSTISPVIHGHIDLRDVQFRYQPDREVFDGLNLTIEAGQTVALVGDSGSGKSSLIRLLARFYEFQSGRITIDGHDIRSLDLENYRRHVGIINQNPILFSGTVADNIRYDQTDVPDERLVEIVNDIADGDWLVGLQDGLQTQVHARGENLSAGQRQLILLARLMLQDPSIVILDEATASMDPITESLVQVGIRTALADRTTLIIAHKLSTVKHADRILVLKDCQIVEDGPHDELLAHGSHYATLYDLYFRHQDLAPQALHRRV
jgi:ATP-binding cassette subfamily B protein